MTSIKDTFKKFILNDKCNELKATYDDKHEITSLNCKIYNDLCIKYKQCNNNSLHDAYENLCNNHIEKCGTTEEQLNICKIKLEKLTKSS